MGQYYMLNKPRGLLTAKRDARRETVMVCFPPQLQQVLHPVGRLDKDSDGLLLFTDDGKLDERLLRPERHVQKEYLFYSFGALDEDAFAQLRQGVPILRGTAVSRPARAQLVGYSTIGQCAERLPERFREKYLKNPQRPVTVGKLWITEGRKHQVRMMVRAVGGFVFSLTRTAIGSLRLDETLAPGAYRALRAQELQELLQERG